MRLLILFHVFSTEMSAFVVPGLAWVLLKLSMIVASINKKFMVWLSKSFLGKCWQTCRKYKLDSFFATRTLTILPVVKFSKSQVGDSDVGNIVMLVTNISNLPPTHFVSNIRHQHRCNPQVRIIWLSLQELYSHDTDSARMIWVTPWHKSLERTHTVNPDLRLHQWRCPK